MEIPTGLEINEGREKVVCVLKKALYGLKQTPRCWNLKITSVLNRFNLRKTNADKRVYVGTYGDCKVYLALFVDDGIIAAKSTDVIEKIISGLSKEFEITIGDCSCFVGMQISRDRETRSMFVHQEAYAKKVIERFGVIRAKGVSVPADSHTILYPVDSEDTERQAVPYREAVGSLMFLAVVTRPDIAYAVNLVSNFLNEHKDSHWQAVKRIIAYLIDTANMRIEFRTSGSGIELAGYSDADFASDIATRRWTTGYAFCIGNGIVTWSSQRQKLVSLSTTESEYIAASTAAKETIWLRAWLSEQGYL